MRARFIAIAASAVTACALLPGSGAAQTYPARPVKIVAFIQSELARWSAFARERKISLDE